MLRERRERIAPPSLNLAGEEYDRGATEQFRNVLRLFFTRLTAIVNQNIDDIDTVTYVPLITDANTSRTISYEDRNSLIMFTSGSPVTVSVPQDSDEDLNLGFQFTVMQYGTGTVTVAAGTGATLNVPTSAATSAQYGSLRVVKTGADTFTVMDN